MHELLGRTTCQALCLAARMFFNMKRTWFHLKRLPGWSLNLIKPQFEAPLKQSRDKSFSNILGYICAAPRDENGISFNRVWKWFSESFVTVDYKNFPNYPELHVLLLFFFFFVRKWERNLFWWASGIHTFSFSTLPDWKVCWHSHKMSTQ